MTQAKIKFANFDTYLAWSDDPENYLEGRFELVDGELVEVPPESGVNHWIARSLMFLLVNSGQVPLQLIVSHSLELQVPVLRSGDSANRYPDLVILQPEHIFLTQKRLTITLDMPPPQLVAEVLSPGKQNQERDRIRKRDQYAARGIPEYWLVEPEAQTVMVLQWQTGSYEEVGLFKGDDLINSPTFPDLKLTANQLFQAES